MSQEGKGRTALITGASAGIGEQFARVFASNGFDVVLTARREERLTKLADAIAGEYDVQATVVAADLARPDAPVKLFEEMQQREIQVDALVNNAGYGVGGFLGSSPWEVHADFLQVMVTAVVHLSYLFEAGMTERGYGRIINVSSLAGLSPGSAGHTLYSASKSFVIKFSESMYLEHADDDVNVCAVCPGFTYSEFHDVLGNRSLVSKLPKFMWMDARTVAEQGYDAVMKKNPVLVNGPVNQAIAAVARLIPQRAALSLMQRQSSKIRVAD